MGRLTNFEIMSLDGYVADANGDFSWAAPDEEAHRFANALAAQVDTYLYGRRMYEVMSYWETVGDDDEDVMVEFARQWRDTDKVVYSTTLDEVSTARTTLERRFDPDAVRELVASAEREVAISGPTLASAAFEAGLVDEVQLLVVPAIVGSGLRGLPDGVRLDLELRESRTFEASGAVFLRYEVRR